MCKHIVETRHIMSYGHYKGSKLKKWPSNSLKVISNHAIHHVVKTSRYNGETQQTVITGIQTGSAPGNLNAGECPVWSALRVVCCSAPGDDDGGRWYTAGDDGVEELHEDVAELESGAIGECSVNSVVPPPPNGNAARFINNSHLVDSVGFAHNRSSTGNANRMYTWMTHRGQCGFNGALNTAYALSASTWGKVINKLACAWSSFFCPAFAEISKVTPQCCGGWVHLQLWRVTSQLAQNPTPTTCLIFYLAIACNLKGNAIPSTSSKSTEQARMNSADDRLWLESGLQVLFSDWTRYSLKDLLQLFPWVYSNLFVNAAKPRGTSQDRPTELRFNLPLNTK